MAPKKIIPRITKSNPIQTERFDLRDLTQLDASVEYLSWLTDSNAKKFIVATKTTQSLNQLQAYILERTDSDHVRFFGIYERYTKKHIGNIKYEPINSKRGYAIMGVLIGNPHYRGLGVFGEVYHATSCYMRDIYNLHNIFLAVDLKNSSAIKSYKKAGFLITETHPLSENRNRIVMAHSLNQVNQNPNKTWT